MAKKHDHGFEMLAVVSIIAVVGLVLMFMNTGKTTSVGSSGEDLAGEAFSKLKKQQNVVSVTKYYLDNDGDGYGTDDYVFTLQPPYSAEYSGDCNDDNSDVNPGQTAYFSEPYDSITNVGSNPCGGMGGCTDTPFWLDSLPACGEVGDLVIFCEDLPWPTGCQIQTQTVVRTCNFDYNCDGVESQELTILGYDPCDTSLGCTETPHWSEGSVPYCGSTATKATYCNDPFIPWNPDSCEYYTVETAQACK